MCGGESVASIYVCTIREEGSNIHHFGAFILAE